MKIKYIAKESAVYDYQNHLHLVSVCYPFFFFLSLNVSAPESSIINAKTKKMCQDQIMYLSNKLRFGVHFVFVFAQPSFNEILN